jgi:hypothetical protein
VHLVHGGLAGVRGEGGAALQRATEERAEELVQVSQEDAITVSPGRGDDLESAHNWADVVSLAGMLMLSGAAPPPSRKFTETPALPPELVEVKPPSKYGARLTAVPLNVPGARMPATLMPTLGLVSVRVSLSHHARGMEDVHSFQ